MKWSLFFTVNSPNCAAHQKVDVRHVKMAASRGIGRVRRHLMAKIMSSNRGGHLAFFMSGGVRMRAAHRMASMVCLWVLRGSPCMMCHAWTPAM